MNHDSFGSLIRGEGGGIFTTGNKSVNIEGLDIGFSEEGLTEYRKKLQDSLITETETVLKNVNAIEAAINDGWQGRSRDIFMEQFSQTIDTIIGDLNKEYLDLNSRFMEIENNYITQDEELMNN